MNSTEKLNYVEFAAQDLEATKAFFTKAFGWQFQDYGPDYIAFDNEGLNGGFFRADACSTCDTGGALLVFYSGQLENCRSRVLAAGGVVSKDIFDFPGGRRFHFIEPSGNELAVWSDRKPLEFN